MSFLTPEDILNKIASFQSYEPVKVKGKILENEHGFFKLEYNNYKINLLFNKDELLPLDQLVEVEGIVKCIPHPNGGIYPKIEVRKFQIIENTEQLKNEDLYLREKELLEIIRKKALEIKKLHPNVHKLLSDFSELSKKEKIKITILHGKDAQTHKDFLTGLARAFPQYEKYITVSLKETSLISDKQLAETIKSASLSSDMIFIVRGGGNPEELKSIGGFSSCKTIAECTKPVYVALGHSLDKNISLIEKVADEHFPTPTLAGVELGKALELSLLLLDLKEKNNQFLKLNLEINNLKNNLSSLKSQRNILLIISTILLLLITLTILK